MSSAGSYGYLKNSLTYSNSNGKGDLLVSFSSDIRSDGYRENSSYKRNSILLSYNHRIGEKLTGSLLISGSLDKGSDSKLHRFCNLCLESAGSCSFMAENGGNKSPDRILAGYKLKYQPSNNLEIISSLFGTFRENEENRPFNFLDESGLSYGGRFLARYAKNTGKINYKITGGSNLFFELYNNSIFENPGWIGSKGRSAAKGKRITIPG